MRYICINGHDQEAPGIQIATHKGSPIYQCRVETCRAEAEPVDEQDAEYVRLVNQPIGAWEVGR